MATIRKVPRKVRRNKESQSDYKRLIGILLQLPKGQKEWERELLRFNKDFKWIDAALRQNPPDPGTEAGKQPVANTPESFMRFRRLLAPVFCGY